MKPEKQVFYRSSVSYDILAHTGLFVVFVIGAVTHIDFFPSVLAFIGCFSILSYFESVAEFLSLCCSDSEDEGHNKRLDSTKSLSRFLNYLPYMIFVLYIIVIFMERAKQNVL